MHEQYIRIGTPWCALSECVRVQEAEAFSNSRVGYVHTISYFTGHYDIDTDLQIHLLARRHRTFCRHFGNLGAMVEGVSDR